jgi:hypothetical protein
MNVLIYSRIHYLMDFFIIILHHANICQDLNRQDNYP